MALRTVSPKLIRKTRVEKNSIAFGLFRCSCGRAFEARIAFVKNGHTKSCGCLKKGLGGASRSPLYQVWANMMRRCRLHKDYAGRGIVVEKRWHDATKFIVDMSPTYRCGLTLGRINNDGPYSRRNCRWETRKQQARNKRTSRLLTFRGKTLTVAGWAENLGLPENTIRSRLFLYGWSLERALTTK